MSGGFDEALAGSGPRVREPGNADVCPLILSVMPVVVDVPWPRQRVIGYGGGPKKMSEQF